MSYYISNPLGTSEGSALVSINATGSSDLTIQGGFYKAYFYCSSTFVLNGAEQPAGVPINLEWGRNMYKDDLVFNPSGNTVYIHVTY